MQVLDSSNNTVASQLNPVLSGGSIASDRFQLVFVASLPALGVAHYLITTGSEQLVRAELQYINHSPPSRYICTTHILVLCQISDSHV